MLQAIKDYKEMVIDPQFTWIKTHKIAYAVAVSIGVLLTVGSYLYLRWHDCKVYKEACEFCRNLYGRKG